MRREARPLSAEEYRAWIDFLMGDHWIVERVPSGAMAALWSMTVCGLRIGEASSMERSWHENTHNGPQLMITGGGQNGTPKTENGVRAVPIPPKMECYHTGETIQLPANSLIQAHFVGNQTIGRSSGSIRRWFYKLAKHSNLMEMMDTHDVTPDGFESPITIPDVQLHDLRASWAAQCLRSGVSRYTVRDWGGWSGLDMVDRYAKYVGDPGGNQIAKF